MGHFSFLLLEVNRKCLNLKIPKKQCKNIILKCGEKNQLNIYGDRSCGSETGTQRTIAFIMRLVEITVVLT